MRRAIRHFLSGRTAAAVLILMLSSTAAEADWLFTPMIGTTFGADTFGRERPTFDAAVAWVDEEPFGWEAQIGVSPDFFEGDTEEFEFGGTGSVVSAMANVLLGSPLGGGDAMSFRPYVTGGVGFLQMRVTSDGGLFTSTTREFGYNLGAGAIAFVGSRVGIRGDLRYLSSFQNQLPSWTRGVDVDIAPGRFDFWRAGVGVTFRLGGE